MTILLYFAFALCYLSTETAFASQRKCDINESTCRDFTTAATCGAVHDCINEVWNTEEFRQSISDTCSTCVSDIAYIRSSINSTVTKQVLESLLDNICDAVIILRLIRKYCEQLIAQYVDNNLNELLDLLNSEVDPSVICHLFGFCFSANSLLFHGDEATVRFRNIELHLPASSLKVTHSEMLLGSTACTWGPSYWCANLTSARQCGTTSHCIQSQWNANKYQEDTDFICKTCTDTTIEARSHLQNTKADFTLRDLFENACKTIPLKTVSEDCVQFVYEFTPQITSMLVSKMSPTAVCTVSGLCNNEHIDSILKETPIVGDTVLDTCANCTVLYAAVSEHLQVTLKNVVLTEMLGICNKMSSLSELCTKLLNSSFDRNYALLRQMGPDMCYVIGTCTSFDYAHPYEHTELQVKKAQNSFAQASDDLPCDLCKLFVSYFKKNVVSNSTEDQILDYLKDLCQGSGSFKDDCLKLVEDDISIIYNFLTKELDPSSFCAEIDLCLKTNKITDDGLNLIRGREFLTDVSIANTIQHQKTPVKSIECILCKNVIDIIQKELDDPSVAHNIAYIVKTVCELVPPSDEASCRDFIDQYSEKIIYLLSHGAAPYTICSFIQICLEPKKVEKFELCPLCEYVLHYTQQVLQNPHIEKKIKHDIKLICHEVPKQEEKICNNFVNQYSALIISLLEQEIDPSVVCPALKFCPSVQTAENRCSYCKQSMNKLIDDLKGHDKEVFIGEMKRFVVASPKHMQEVTLEIKIHHSEDIEGMLEAEFTGDESCVYLKYCSPN